MRILNRFAGASQLLFRGVVWEVIPSAEVGNCPVQGKIGLIDGMNAGGRATKRAVPTSLSGFTSPVLTLKFAERRSQERPQRRPSIGLKRFRGRWLSTRPA